MTKPAATKKQKRAFRYALRNPYCIVGMDPRLGKSRVGIGVQKRTKLNCVVVCPGYLVENWVTQIKEWHNPDVQISIFQKGKDIIEVCDNDFVVVSFDLAQKAEHIFDWADMCIIDEGHNLKSMDAKRTQFIHKSIYEYSLQRCIILTGTPIKNRVKEFYSLIALTYYNPKQKNNDFLDRFPTEIDFADYFSYRKEYTMEIGGRFVTVVKWEGIRRINELKQYLKGKYIRIKADDKDLPPVFYNPILISETEDKELLKAFNAYFKEEGNESVASDMKAKAAMEKVPFTIKFAQDLLETKKCAIIYSDHRESAEAIAKHFGVKALTGKVPSKLRSRLATEFQNGEGRILVATIGALKEGRDLFRSRDIILNDYPWVPGDVKQVINRIRAMSVREKCTVHQIMGSPQDKYIIETMDKKIKVIEQIA